MMAGRSKGDVNGASKSGGGAGKARGTDHERDKGAWRSDFFAFCDGAIAIDYSVGCRALPPDRAESSGLRVAAHVAYLG